ncbi:hypothetical protein G7B40_017720 [Aetokthonos hydrillicola Thurmond2011]|jgi:Fe-S cluster biosynthesis and repair protein YggX|uniref:Uncharacterized protein n=1 Tax=Aetokthonos hydrillicola Thurmond2011 TaxID=2712845 RepID=A0AAP5IAX7_9CYAN|nr:hypothetical protein [Aetokthonos hydrillicola]MBO3458202.1 hypothetical protein [Aetokthonos hydrillicola CCALA 1050]MBW4584422.1 hypothetical protein [Aetokthonos hydrillicola CCALA 1050]MDR9896383.1 hypothetical protein [Aetokthonos hydrillicola Thurmond2011]
METHEILQALPKLSTKDCVKIAETALELIHQEQKSLTKDEQKRLLEAAAKTAIEDYVPGRELIVFSEMGS